MIGPPELQDHNSLHDTVAENNGIIENPVLEEQNTVENSAVTENALLQNLRDDIVAIIDDNNITNHGTEENATTENYGDDFDTAQNNIDNNLFGGNFDAEILSNEHRSEESIVESEFL